MKLGQTSLLSMAIILLKKIPYVGEYYKGQDEPADGVSHFWTGQIVTGWFSVLMIFSKWFGLGIVLFFIVHVIVKEVILDAHKRVNQQEWKAFKVDMTLRVLGFVTAAWMPTIILIK